MVGASSDGILHDRQQASPIVSSTHRIQIALVEFSPMDACPEPLIGEGQRDIAHQRTGLNHVMLGQTGVLISKWRMEEFKVFIFDISDKLTLSWFKYQQCSIKASIIFQ